MTRPAGPGTGPGRASCATLERTAATRRTGADPAGARTHRHLEADTPGGRAFDAVLLVLIVASVLLVMVESVPGFRADHAGTLQGSRGWWRCCSTLECAARLIATEQPGRYARSFFGIIDLLAILPVNVSVLSPGAQSHPRPGSGRCSPPAS